MIELSKKNFYFSILLIGFSTIIIQTVYIREFLTLFYGNEIVIGSFLGIWLFWTAIGSGWLSNLIRNHKNSLNQFTNIQLIWILVSIITQIFIRALPLLLHLQTGEITGYFHIFWIIFMTIAPYCVFSGTLYSLACRLHMGSKSTAATWYGHIYLLEAVGAMLGGLMISFIFLAFLSPFQTISLIVGLNLIFIFIRCLKYKILLLSMISLSLFIIVLSPKIEHITQKWLWQEQNVKTTQTKYGNLAFTETGEQYNFFSNGLHLFSIPDLLTAEENVHLAMLQHKNPEKVLLIGGGLSGTIPEILKYPSIKKLDYVELDPMLIEFVKNNLPEYLHPPSDKRIQYHFSDGRRFIQNSKNHYDIIGINVPNPYTLQLNRFYTVEFFKMIKNHLTPEGIVTICLPGSENIIGPDLANYIKSIETTLQKVFGQVTIFPGETSRVIASPKSQYITSDVKQLIKRLRSQKIKTKYVQDYYLEFQLSQERIHNFKEQLNYAQIIKTNKDNKPIAYYFDILIWATYFSKPFKKFFLLLSEISFKWILLFSITISIIIAWYSRIKKIPSTHWIYSICIIGFTEISIEYIYILLFQIYFGFVFYQIAIIIACYMTGLALGSFVSLNKPIEKYHLETQMVLIQGMMCLSLIVFTLIILRISDHTPGSYIQQTCLILLAIFLVVSGFLGGFQFIIANHLIRKTSVQKQLNAAGLLYGVDLLGSSAGIVLTTILIIPIFGITHALYLLITINIFAFIFVLSHSKYS